MAVVAGHAASQAGSMASKGAYQSTRVSMRAWSNLMSRNSATEKAQEQVSVDKLNRRDSFAADFAKLHWLRLPCVCFPAL